MLVAHRTPQGDARHKAQQIARKIVLGTILSHQSPYRSLDAHQEQGNDDAAHGWHVIELHEELAQIVGKTTWQHDTFQEITSIKEKHLVLLLKAQAAHIGNGPKHGYSHTEEQRQQRFPK